MIGIFVSEIDNETRSRELPFNREFVEFLVEELIPFVSQRYPVTKDPALTVAVGSSFGGLAALNCAFMRPERFGLVAAQAASAAYSPEPTPERGLVLRILEEHQALWARFHLCIGSRETYVCPGYDQSGVIAHREMVKMISERAPDVKSIEYEGSHDYICWRYSLPLALQWLFNQSN